MSRKRGENMRKSVSNHEQLLTIRFEELTRQSREVIRESRWLADETRRIVEKLNQATRSERPHQVETVPDKADH